MATPASGQIAFSDIAWVVYANYNAYTELNNSDIRYLLGVSSGQISITSAYSKPANNSYSYTSPGAYSLVVPAYQYFSVDVRGGGAGGNGGNGSNTNACWCGQLCFFPCCGGQSGGNPGGDGGPSYIRGGGIDVTAYGGYNGGGYGGNVIGGGGGGGGSAGVPWGCTGGYGSAGGGGGRVTNTFTKSSGSVPYYGHTCTVLVGGGGGGGWHAGGNGGDGAVYVSTS
jgi:hypothetical protein